ncbi:hypothetical protein niasHT_017042 [Heterodera trifolii]|uniref:RING-type domain-containing protein n=1 Tax=Heterodera trifolii TaxID=157864 RepID=A0ABD2KXW5_9BILA
MESVKITESLAYKVKETSGNDTFVAWKAKGCAVLWDQEMLRLELDGTAKERSELRADIFNGLRKAQQKLKESGKKESQQMAILETQIPSSRCGLIIGTEGETIKKIKADSEVHTVYIDATGQQKVKREPRQNFSWLVICSSDVNRIAKALERVEELLEFGNKFEHWTVPMGRRNGTGSEGAEENGTGRTMAVQKMRIPAAELFGREQMRRFEQISHWGKKSHGVSIELDSSDPGQSFRLVTLSGTENGISSVKMELKGLIDEVKAAMPAEHEKKRSFNGNSTGDEYPSPPAEPIGGSFGSVIVRNRKETNGGLSRRKANGAPSDPVQPRKADKFKKEVLVPKKCIVHVIGNGGENIRHLQDKFGVKMHFLGNNYLEYPNGRTLAIIGDTEEKVESARDHVDREFILKRWEAWNTGQNDNVEEEATTYEEIYQLSPKFALREDLELVMKQIKDQSGIVSYCYRQFSTGHRPIILRGTEQTVAEAIKILKKMEQEWPQQRTMANSRARSLDEISITSFVESISKLNISKTSEEAANNGEAKRKEAQKGAKGTKSGGKTAPGGGKEAMNGDSGENGKDTDEAEKEGNLNRSANWQKERRRKESDGIANTLMGSEPPQQQTAEDIQQSLLNSVKDACEKMNGLMQSKDAQISRILCTECGQSERAVLFTPCRHFLCCQKCADSFQECPICKRPSKKLLIYLE